MKENLNLEEMINVAKSISVTAIAK